MTFMSAVQRIQKISVPKPANIESCMKQKIFEELISSLDLELM